MREILIDKKRQKKKLLYVAFFAILLLVLITVCVFVYKKNHKSDDQTPVVTEKVLEKPVENSQTSENYSPASTNAVPQKEESLIPRSAEIKMQFASQAPDANWDEPYQNACEEASIIMVNYYLKQKNLTKEIMNQEILSMVEWQIKNWSGHDDLTSEKTIELAKNYYGLRGESIYDYSVDKIKLLIAQGVPVIIPADGKKLNNPNFKNGGPEYHMLVIKGYTENEFITNDPGTRKGEGYRYKYDAIINSVKNPDGGTKLVFTLSNQ